LLFENYRPHEVRRAYPAYVFDIFQQTLPLRFTPYICALKKRDSFLNEVYTNNVSSGDVLLAIRPYDRVTAYYMGCQFFTIKLINKHPDPHFYRAYLPVVRSDVLRERKNSARVSSKKPVDKYPMTESDWQKEIGNGLKLSRVLPEILDNLNKDSRPEGCQVSYLYKYSPLVANNPSDIVLLDIEAEFSQSGTGKSDRVDVVLFHTLKKQLLFLEVKRLSDARLQKNGNVQLAVTRQLSRYQTIINDQADNIIEQYNHVIDTYNVINASVRQTPHIGPAFEIKLGLLVVDYSRKDLGSLKVIKAQSAMQNAKTVAIGHAKNVTPKTLESWFA